MLLLLLPVIAFGVATSMISPVLLLWVSTTLMLVSAGILVMPAVTLLMVPASWLLLWLILLLLLVFHPTLAIGVSTLLLLFHSTLSVSTALLISKLLVIHEATSLTLVEISASLLGRATDARRWLLCSEADVMLAGVSSSR